MIQCYRDFLCLTLTLSVRAIRLRAHGSAVVTSFFGLVDNFVTRASDLNARQTQVFNGVDVGVNARFAGGAFAAGGVSTGRTVTDSCYTIDSPQQRLFCHVSPPWMAGTQFKANVLYPLPWWGLQTSVIWQNLPAAADEATLAVPNAQIAPSLGRNLAACPATTGACHATATIRLYPTLSVFEPHRLNQFDFPRGCSKRVCRSISDRSTRRRSPSQVFAL